jgi:Family of unknown function (DUF6510)
VQRLDGNALAGALFDHFGAEMTSVRGSCGTCGASAQIAELRVYASAPGKVARCPRCGNVVFVLVQLRDASRAYLGGFRLPRREPAPE